MTEENIELMQPTPALKAALQAMAEEYREYGENRHQGLLDDFEGSIRKLEESSRGRNLPAGYVPATTFFLVRSGQTILGRSSLRHRLTPALEHEGGHIGYDVRPSQRRKGYGTLILALTLEKAREMGLTRVLVTCDTDNVASRRIIQKNGGKFQDEVISERSGKPVCRYWIDL